MKTWTGAGFFTTGSFLAAAVFVAASLVSCTEAPRYHLEVGQVLAYDISWTAHHPNEPEDRAAGTEILVVTGKQGDGWTLAAFGTVRSWAGTSSPLAATQPAPTETTLGAAVLHPDGRIDPCDGFDLAHAGLLFLPLPNAGQSAPAYSAPGRNGDTLLLRATQRGEKVWVLQAQHAAPENQVYAITFSSQVTLDVIRGLPQEVEWTVKEEDHDAFTGNGVLKLTDVGEKSPAQAARLAADVATLASASQAYQAVALGLTGDEATMRDALRRAGETFRQAGAGVHTPEIRAV